MATSTSPGGIQEIGARWRGPSYLSDSRRQQALILVTRQLTRLVKAKAPLVDGLMVCALDSPSLQIRDLLLAIRQNISEGDSLHRAMERRGRFFPKYYIDLVRSGEETGRVYECLCELEEELIASGKFYTHFVSHFVYVGAVLLFGIAMAWVTWLWTLPQIALIVSEFEVRPPLPLRALIYLREYPWATNIVLAVSLLIVFAAIFYFYSKGTQGVGGQSAKQVGRLMLKVPGLRSIFIKRNLAHVSAVLFRLLGGGVPLAAALETAATSGINPVFQEIFLRITKRVKEGDSLNVALKGEELIPAAYREMLTLGESSGYLADTLGRLARTYRREALKTSRILVDICAPFVLLAIAIGIGIVYGSVFMCFTQISGMHPPMH
ncbi:MAG: type II secretion system F family protein [Candidatus Hydrogenedentes bacterium]|nr:type II secretion system F family protein [Candidatus Hydrogenedentota bacterium]